MALPYAGLLPFVPVADRSAVLVHASRLARHTQGLRADARSASCCTSRTARTRTRCRSSALMFDCTVQPFDRKSAEWEAGTRRLPGALSRRRRHLRSRRLHAVPARSSSSGTVRRRLRARDGHRTAEDIARLAGDRADRRSGVSSARTAKACSARARGTRAGDAPRSCRACCRGAAGAGCPRRRSASRAGARPRAARSRQPR